MSDAARQQVPISATQRLQRLWSGRAIAALSKVTARMARTNVDLVVTLAIFSGVGLVASLILLLLDHQLNGQLPTL